MRLRDGMEITYRWIEEQLIKSMESIKNDV